MVNGQWYSADERYGLRLDAGIVQNELRSEMAKALLSLGAKLDDTSKLVVSTGWLQRYVWDDSYRLFYEFYPYDGSFRFS